METLQTLSTLKSPEWLARPASERIARWRFRRCFGIDAAEMVGQLRYRRNYDPAAARLLRRRRYCKTNSKCASVDLLTTADLETYPRGAGKD
jgi:hypothetical protein